VVVAVVCFLDQPEVQVALVVVEMVEMIVVAL
jgi:hypothetical protein